MTWFIEKPLRAILRRSKELLKSSDRVQSLLYDIHNAEHFTDLLVHERMLADVTRLRVYKEAIDQYIGSDDVVVDLGTGTGVLTLLASKKTPKAIYSIDQSDIIEVAKQIADRNSVGNIDFLRGNSRNFDPESKVDVLLHEQIGDDLFDERMIENILDLKSRLLTERGRILPNRFELFLEPVCLKECQKLPFIWEHKIEGFDFSFLKSAELIEGFKPPGYDRPHLSTSAFDYLLCAPEPVLTFDLEQMDSVNDLPTVVRGVKEVTRDGSMDGVCLYFKVLFDDRLSFDSSPFNAYTHWRNRVFRKESRHYSSGQQLKYEVNFGDFGDAQTWEIVVD